MSDQPAPDGASFLDLLDSTYGRLLAVERSIDRLAEASPEGYIAWASALTEAAQARNALGQAPSLRGRPATPAVELDASVDGLLHHTEELDRAVITASSIATDPDDKLACLTTSAALGRLYEALE